MKRDLLVERERERISPLAASFSPAKRRNELSVRSEVGKRITSRRGCRSRDADINSLECIRAGR